MGSSVPPLPPPKHPFDVDHPAYRMAREREEYLRKHFKETFSALVRAHKLHYGDIEEEYMIMWHYFLRPSYLNLFSERYWEWFFDTNKGEVYTYLLRYLQVLSSGYSPKSHWLLKSPMHIVSFQHLLATFPDARIVMTHRDPKKVIPSLKSLLDCGSKFMESKEAQNSNLYIKYNAQALKGVLKRRKCLDYHQIVDIGYRELTENPIGVVQKIYAHYNIRVSRRFVERMTEWLKNNPQVVLVYSL
jgi:hypothetical protein